MRSFGLPSPALDPVLSESRRATLAAFAQTGLGLACAGALWLAWRAELSGFEEASAALVILGALLAFATLVAIRVEAVRRERFLAGLHDLDVISDDAMPRDLGHRVVRVDPSP